MQSVFEAIDLDKSGNSGKKGYRALKMIDKVATEGQVEKRINKYDVDKDGQVRRRAARHERSGLLGAARVPPFCPLHFSLTRS